MPRPKRHLKPTFAVYCEGDTEQNYTLGMKRSRMCSLSIKPVNMHGGGYTSFLSEIKKGESSNYLAKFIIVDLDRALDDPGEIPTLEKLIAYCVNVNRRKGSIPHFLIIDNPDFEFLACLHFPSYKNQNVKIFIESTLGYGNIDSFKSDEKVYEYLNTEPASYTHMLSKLPGVKFYENIYTVKKSTMDIVITECKKNWDAVSVRGSNINEFFDVIGLWKRC
jgi:hypothetical protein